MHLLKHPRNAALLGILFIVIAIIYFVVPTALGLDIAMLDIAAGTTMLLGLGIAMAIMAYVLAVGTRGE
jgi:hypothetical protein